MDSSLSLNVSSNISHQWVMFRLTIIMLYEWLGIQRDAFIYTLRMLMTIRKPIGLADYSFPLVFLVSSVCLCRWWRHSSLHSFTFVIITLVLVHPLLAFLLLIVINCTTIILFFVMMLQLVNRLFRKGQLFLKHVSRISKSYNFSQIRSLTKFCWRCSLILNLFIIKIF